MTMQRFDITIDGLQDHHQISPRYHGKGEFVDADVAQALYDALEAYTRMTHAPSAIAQKGQEALAKARGES